METLALNTTPLGSVLDLPGTSLLLPCASLNTSEDSIGHCLLPVGHLALAQVQLLTSALDLDQRATHPSLEE